MYHHSRLLERKTAARLLGRTDVRLLSQRWIVEAEQYRSFTSCRSLPSQTTKALESCAQWDVPPLKLLYLSERGRLAP